MVIDILDLEIKYRLIYLFERRFNGRIENLIKKKPMEPLTMRKKTLEEPLMRKKTLEVLSGGWIPLR